MTGKDYLYGSVAGSVGSFIGKGAALAFDLRRAPHTDERAGQKTENIEGPQDLNSMLVFSVRKVEGSKAPPRPTGQGAGSNPSVPEKQPSPNSFPFSTKQAIL